MELTKRLHEIVFSVLHLYSISFITLFIVTMSRRKIKAKQYIQTKWNYVIADLQIQKIKRFELAVWKLKNPNKNALVLFCSS